MTVLLVEATAGSLPLEHLLLSQMDATTSSCRMAPASEHHEPKTVAARTDSSESECCIFDTVSPPREKAHSTSVDVAAK
jgi:hypothetical protein